MSTKPTDYTPGDEPVAVGTVVEYHGHSGTPGLYEIIEHRAPREESPDPEVNYPDGVAYFLWPVGVARKFGNRDQAVYFVRRTSFTIAPH